MSISSLGIGSGVLTADLVDQLVEAERGPTENRLDSQEEVLNAQVSEFGALKGLVSDFESSVSALNLSSSFKNNTASSTNENAVTATASSVASPGLYSIEVDSLAQRQTIASLEFSNLNDIVGEGTLKFTFGTVGTTRDANGNVTSFDSFTANTSEAVKTLKVDATNHTVTGLRDAINKSDLGISATIVDTGSGYRLLLQSQDSGEDNGFKVEVSNASNGLDGFNFNETTTGAGLLHTGLASDAQFKVNGLNVTREDNLVAGVINGVTLNLKQTTSGPVNLTIERDTAAVASKMSDLVDSYNALKGRINELAQFDTEEGKGSLFTGDSTVRTLQVQMQRVIGGVVSSLSGTEFRALSEVGIKTNKDTGLLEFDSGKFTSLLNNDPDAMTTLFTRTGTTTDSQLAFQTGGTNTAAGTYDVVISQLATRGEFVGNGTSGSFTIDADNDTFKINVDGTNSQSIQLSAGTYTGTELAQLLQAQINADENLLSRAKSVEVTYDAGKQSFSIESSTFGSSSSVNFTALDTDTARELGFYVPGQGPRSLEAVNGLSVVDTLSAPLVIDDSNDDFSLTVAGVTSNNIELANASYTDGSDLAAALQSAINADSNFSAEGLTATVSFEGSQSDGQLKIAFSDGETFAIESADAGLASALGITTGKQETDQVASLALNDDFSSAVTIDSSNDEFTVVVNGTTSNTIQIANASYADGASLAAAIQSALQADTNLQGVDVVSAAGATTSAGSLDIAAAGIDFSSVNRGLLLNFNGIDLEVRVDQDATTDLNSDTNVGDVDDNLFAVQSALDSALTAAGLSAGDIVASVSGNGLVLTSAAQNSSQTLQVVADGIGAETGAGTTVLAGGENYSALGDATFALDVDGTTVNVDLSSTVDGTGAANTDVLAQIQTALDSGLTTAGLNAGDVEVRLNGSGQVVFYDTQNQASTNTLSVSAVGADDVLGLTAQVGVSNSGSDGFGLSLQTVNGVDQETLANSAQVTFEGGNANGNFKFDFGNGQTFTIETAEANMGPTLGIQASDGSEDEVIKGLDVAGTINGKAATGTGQTLVGAEGDASEGLRVSVSGGPVGKRGSVEFVRGIADQLDRLLDNVLTGSLKNKEDAMQRELSQIAEERTELNDRIDIFRTRLEKQFAYNDILVQQLDSTRDYLETQFEILNASLSRS